MPGSRSPFFRDPARMVLSWQTPGAALTLETRRCPIQPPYRDSRCAALMLPYTTEIMEDYLSVMTLYEMDEMDRVSADTESARNSMWRPKTAVPS